MAEQDKPKTPPPVTEIQITRDLRKMGEDMHAQMYDAQVAIIQALDILEHHPDCVIAKSMTTVLRMGITDERRAQLIKALTATGPWFPIEMPEEESQATKDADSGKDGK